MALLQQIHKTQQELEAQLMKRMADFETQLQASSPPVDSLAKLSEEFRSFQKFVWSVLSLLRQQIMDLSSTVDSMETRQRRKTLLFTGIPENAAETSVDVVTNILQDQLKLPVNSVDISVCHRLGESSTGKPRPLLVRFKDHSMRQSVWRNKTMLKGSSFVICEFLTKSRQALFIKARNHFGMRSCWTSDGLINIKSACGTRVKICNADELDKAMERFPKASTESDMTSSRKAPSKPGSSSSSAKAATRRVGTRSNAAAAGKRE